jgi:hypothetical protein
VYATADVEGGITKGGGGEDNPQITHATHIPCRHLCKLETGNSRRSRAWSFDISWLIGHWDLAIGHCLQTATCKLVTGA